VFFPYAAVSNFPSPAVLDSLPPLAILFLPFLCLRLMIKTAGLGSSSRSCCSQRS